MKKLLWICLFMSLPILGWAQAFTFPLTVSDGTNLSSIIFGASDIGSPDFKEGLDRFAPPTPPEGAFDARFIYNNDSYQIKFVDTTKIVQQVEFKYQKAAGTDKITLTISKNSLSDQWLYLISDVDQSDDLLINVDTLNLSFVPEEIDPRLADGFLLTVKPKVDYIQPDVEFSRMGGNFTSAFSLNLSSQSDNDIYYTTDGSEPTINSTLYSSEIFIFETTTIKAISVGDNGSVSNVFTQHYIFELAPYTDIKIGEENNLDLSGNPDKQLVFDWQSFVYNIPDVSSITVEFASDSLFTEGSKFHTITISDGFRFTISAFEFASLLESYFDSQSSEKIGPYTAFSRVVAHSSLNGNDYPSESSKLMVDRGVFTSIEEENQLVNENTLYQNYPNPFNPTTTIRFDILQTAEVQLSIYNLNGQLIQTLVSENRQTGSYAVSFDASNLTSGVYFYRLQVGSQSFTKKMSLIK